ncbi:endonuclease/exonuclease/phosphatase family protein [Paraburkholderia hospita]|uniref:endonuclease/exonuclease/phosphatase family protein n=1 Tax=Paraburkholderia hospita TaxID=169430 RepID=UPI000DEF87A2|nr:endonuclease/exonuclease/phosphatase family protein [Paraburkholderia hospita]AXE97731.1 hypothetical protein CUJ88_03995 [Paraburkholderia hospita]
MEFVVEQIQQMRDETAFDVLGLGEVCSSDLSAILTALGDSQFGLFDASSRDTRPMFDTAVIYDKTRLSIVNQQSIVDGYGRQKLKTGEVVRFRLIETGDQFTLAFSHWPSRRTASQMEPVRAQLGMALRSSLARLHEGESNSFIILMGDYNDDPFSPSLADHLLATRDRALASRDNRLLYNPFWKWIGESHHDSEDFLSTGFCGTHFYPNGNTTRWFTYDQIIFSSSFLQGGAMVLDEQRCRILAPPLLRNKVMTRSEIFDHLPVLATVEIRSEL